MNRLKKEYQEKIVPKLMKEQKYKSVMQVANLEKVVINMGIGDAVQDNKAIEEAVNELSLITGSKPVIIKAKNSIAGFKLREGMPIGIKVTLRNEKMFVFIDKLINIALPRVRDFRGINKNSFDGHGNYTLGVKEQIIFPEISYDKVRKVRGMDITFVTTAKTNKEAKLLLTKLSFPFKK